MEKPVIGGCLPFKLETIVGETYFYCTCGRSRDGALCDGSHKGTGLSPKRFVASFVRAVLCTCKRTTEAPYCSGAHRGLGPLDVWSRETKH